MDFALIRIQKGAWVELAAYTTILEQVALCRHNPKAMRDFDKIGVRSAYLKQLHEALKWHKKQQEEKLKKELQGQA